MGIKDYKEFKDCEEVSNFCSCPEIKELQRDQDVRRGKELPRVFAKRSRPAKAIKNSCDEGLVKRSKIAKTSWTVEGSRIQSSKEWSLRRGSRKKIKNHEEIEACKEIENSGEEIKDREDIMKILTKGFVGRD